MATKASVILIAAFLLTLPVLAGRTTTHTTTPAQAVAQVVDEATPEVTATEEAGAAAGSALVGDPARGQQIFEKGLNEAPACVNCHNRSVTGRAGFAIGPGLKAISEHAATRVDGMSAAAYVEDSIRHPANYLVAGYQPIMYGLFGEKYNDQDIADVVAYLMTL